MHMIIALTPVLLVGFDGPAPKSGIQFNRDIRPILTDACFACHGPAIQKGKLRLDQEESAKKAKSGAAAIVPGRPDASELIRRIEMTSGDERMPPESSHKTLKPEERSLLRRWIQEDAPYQKHWAFEPPAKPVAPATGNPIDAFVAQTLKAKGLKFSPEADRPTLIRRVSFALTGLPPTLKEVDAFLADAKPGAYERMVDRSLASPRYGEEMARHWLDIARYADTHGLHLDNERQMWAYRDWVVSAFNRNMPFDRFTIEQIAGDLLPNPTQEQLTATGFNRCNVTTGEGGSIDSEWVFRNAVDRTSTVFTAWLGLTGGCVVCHDHKFDPITQRDFYSMYSFFHSAADPPLDGNALLTAPTVMLRTPEMESRLAELRSRQAVAQKSLDGRLAGFVYKDPADQKPKPPEQKVEQVWFDDETPKQGRVFGSPGHPTQLVDAKGGPVFHGTKAIKRVGEGISQDVFEGVGPHPMPFAAKLFAYVWIDPKNPPKSVMLQYFKDGWLHRGVWGDYDAIPWGRAKSTERVKMGPLPPSGKWVRLEIAADRVGFKAGDAVTGFAVTQFGGTVYWDKVGVAGRADPAADPARSFQAWWRERKGKNTQGAPDNVNRLLKTGPQAKDSDADRKLVLQYYLANVCDESRKAFRKEADEVARLSKEIAGIESSTPGTFIYRDLASPRESHVMLRGAYDKPGPKVEPDVPKILPPLKKAGQRGNRLDLAKWLVSREQPLTARVVVNRFWQQFLGTGIVKSSGDFGVQCTPPSHPELLDWLAVDFRENGWDVKALVRTILNSQTFRQQSAAPADSWKGDPENRLLARGPRFRLDAEQLRDNALYVSGLAVLDMGGRGARTYQPPNIWEPVGFTGSNTRVYVQDSGPLLYRRSLYVFIKRTAPAPFLTNFDAPNRETSCTRRERSNTPLQALQLMNDVQHVEAARAFAERILSEGGISPDSRLTFAWRSVLSRKPEPDELKTAKDLLERQLQRYRKDPAAAKALVSVGESKPRGRHDQAELAAYTLAANLLLNLDETITRN